MLVMRSDEDSNAENGVINGVTRHQDKHFKHAQEQVKAMQTSVDDTNEQVKAMQTSNKQTQEQAQGQAKAMHKEVQDKFKGVQEQVDAMQTSIDHTNEQVNAIQTAITQTQDQVAQILSLLQASSATPRQDAQPGPSA